MAARRLLIIMLVLLGISSALAIALPNPDRGEQTSQEATTGETGSTGEANDLAPRPDREPEASAIPAEGPGGAPVRTVNLDAGDRKVIEGTPGTRLILTVKSKTAAEVTIDGLGLSGFADRYAPARFDLLLPEEPGNYRIQTPGEKPAAVIKAGS